MNNLVKRCAEEFNRDVVEKYSIESSKECIEVCLLCVSEIFKEPKDKILDEFKGSDSFVTYHDSVTNDWIDLFGNEKIKCKDFSKRVKKILKTNNKSNIMTLRSILAYDGLRKGDESKYIDNLGLDCTYLNAIREIYGTLKEHDPEEATQLIKNTLIHSLILHCPIFKDIELPNDILQVDYKDIVDKLLTFYNEKTLKRIATELKPKKRKLEQKRPTFRKSKQLTDGAKIEIPEESEDEDEVRAKKIKFDEEETKQATDMLMGEMEMSDDE